MISLYENSVCMALPREKNEVLKALIEPIQAWNKWLIVIDQYTKNKSIEV